MIRRNIKYISLDALINFKVIEICSRSHHFETSFQKIKEMENILSIHISTIALQ